MRVKHIKKMLSVLLCMVVLLSNLPVVSFAAETDGLCEHHTEHLECGYVEDESACSYVCEFCFPVPTESEATEAATEPEATDEATEPEATEETLEPDEKTRVDLVKAGADVHSAPDVDLPESDELFAFFVERELYGYSMATYGIAARAKLNAVEQAIYDALKAKIEIVAANGGSTIFPVSGISNLKTTWTNAELGVTSIENLGLVDAAFMDQFSLNDIITALLADCPYDLYWYDKISGVSMGYQFGMSGYDDGTQVILDAVSVENISFTFSVSADYKAGEDAVTTNVSKVATAKSNAAKVVADHAGKSDYEKLVAYKNYICAAVSYNDAAANDNTTPYGDPWQLISVFDGNSATNVVCEGYSKAFQYLCDLTNFAGDTTCYSVSGWMDGGNHMWNIVTLDGANYLADVTNSDSGTIGASGGLFLDGAYGSVNGGYWVAGCSYQYDSETLSLWGTDADSILKLSNTSYAAEDEEPVAVSGVCGDNLTWVLNGDGTLTISGTGKMWGFIVSESQYFIQTNAPWSDYSDKIKAIDIQAGVTSIGDGAFSLCDKLSDVTLPETLEKIGSSAFRNCSSLTEIEIPAAVTEIGANAFDGCINLVTVKFPGNAPKIASNAFSTVTATALYQPKDTTWNSGNMVNYNGALTWKTYCQYYGHDEVTDPAQAPTCTKKGLSEGKHCAVCKEVLVAQVPVPTVEHEWTDADCDTPKTCSVCKTTSGKPAGHKYDDKVDGTCNSCGVDRATVTYRKKHNMLRMYNPYNGEHFYTGSEVERDNLVAAGWKYEGVAFTFPANTGAPVHRLYEPVSGEHLYTMSEEEKADLLAKGWNYEGVAFNSAYDTEAVQHRLHNPYATRGGGYHFTFSQEEVNALIAAGWIYQGLGWYSCFK